ncbi:AbiU2 domain-containing protein [Almyronema epifaneia]|uniref:HEPN AbiU2-like domain-containing protein n=1 Tax=Almyronema epifaneia S1 TaxID=2991925 RepID=A0ABW6IMF1_9CYAN
MADNNASIEKLKKYIEIVEFNLARASIYLRMQREVEERSKQWISQSDRPINIFLIESGKAFGDAGILLLCKVYEQDSDSIGLKKLVNYLESNHRFLSLEINEIEAFRSQLAHDKSRLDKTQSNLVKKLILFRDKAIAHPGNDSLKREKKIIDTVKELNLAQSDNPLEDILNSFVAVSAEPYPNFPHALTWQEIDSLTDIANEIFLRYKSLIPASDSDVNAVSLKEGIESDLANLVSALEELLN